VYGTIHLMSDERTKTHIVKMENALDKIGQLNGYYYQWKENEAQTEVGMLAQEVEKVLPEAVTENEKGTKFLNYDGLIPVLTQAIKEQQKLIKAQGEALEQLKKEIEILKKK
jgi:flagellar biosynthesis chaperone FliJ